MLLIILGICDPSISNCEPVDLIQKLKFTPELSNSLFYKTYGLQNLKNKYHIIYTSKEFFFLQPNQLITQALTHHCIDPDFCTKILETDMLGGGNNYPQHISNIMYRLDSDTAHLLKVDYSKLKGFPDLEPLIIQHKMNILNGNIPFRELNIPELFKEFKIK